jgi:head-tail adaptor
MQAGRLDRRATFLRRAEEDRPGGARRGDFAVAFTLWAEDVTARRAAKPVIEGGYPSDGLVLVIRVRAGAAARTITAADRVRVGGEEFSITAVGLPDRRNGSIEIESARTLGG